MSLGNTTNVKFFRIFLVLLGAAAGCAGNAVAQEAIGQDLQSIKQLTKAISHAEALLKKYPHNDFTPNLMFQLSELYLKQSALKFQREMMTYEDAEEKFRQGLLSGEPEAPRADFSQTIEVSVSLLEKFQELHFRDKVLYRVALCYSEEGNEDKAAEYFKLLSEATEDSALLEEAYFRLGEYYFERQNYSNTIDYYSRLLNGWDSPFFDMALYKLGWS
ncbi:tetratricopeptide repeat protein, partial [candidate division KSB1 bacterium]|nr:tetratricopeptide repeat protein [candidate division KSB1 bacterium]